MWTFFIPIVSSRRPVHLRSWESRGRRFPHWGSQENWHKFAVIFQLVDHEEHMANLTFRMSDAADVVERKNPIDLFDTRRSTAIFVLPLE